MGTMKLWQACALVAGEDPDLICPPSLGNEYFPNEFFLYPAVTQQFEKVLRLASSVVDDEEGPIFPKGDSRGGRRAKQNKDVVLADVVGYLMGCGAGINIPEQLHNLKPTAAVGTKQAVNTPPHGLMSKGELSQGELSKTRPMALPTGDVAFCFADLKWSERDWKINLGKMPQWLKRCLDTPGERGKIVRLWNPVNIGAALVKKGDATKTNVRARFQAAAQARYLAPWLEEWKAYEADYLNEV